MICILFMLHPMLRTVEPQTITYEVIVYGENALGRNLTSEVTFKAIAMWEEANPDFTFNEGSGGVKIIFIPNLSLLVNGFAICPFWSNSENSCIVLISTDIIDTYPYNTITNKMANVLAHEIGHVFGMMHTSTDGHLMFGHVFGWTFDDRGLTVPEPLGPYGN